jgi:hypothetical protein
LTTEDSKIYGNKAPIVIISKLKARAEGIHKITTVHKRAKFPDELKQFKRDCLRWIDKVWSIKGLRDEELINEYYITEKGDIFKAGKTGDLPNGIRICITHKNKIIQARYQDGVIQRGHWRIFYPTGEYFEGSVEDGGIKNGNGIEFYANGDVYDGEFVNDKRIGKARLRVNDGSEFIGQFIDNEIDGHGIYTDKFGNRFMSMAIEDDHLRRFDSQEKGKFNKDSGYFFKLKLYGKGEIKFKNGNTYVGQFKSGKRDGEGEMSYIVPPKTSHHDIGEYSGSWKRDQRHGFGIMKYTNGCHYEGLWQFDKKSEGVFSLEDGSTYTGKFKNDKFNGKGKLELHNGSTIEGEFENGALKDKGILTKNTSNGKGKKML